MGDANPPGMPSRHLSTALDTSTKPAGWRLVNFDQSTVQPRSDPQKLKHHHEPTPGWSAVHDFERRLSRNGIKMSEANGNYASITAAQSTVQYRGGAGAILDGYARDSAQRGGRHHVSRSEGFPSLEAPTLASFTNTKKETEMEALDRQLRQAQAEAQIWKQRSEKQERDLDASYKETMEWRMKYEDLYSAVIQGLGPRTETLRAKRVGTKSLG